MHTHAGKGVLTQYCERECGILCALILSYGWWWFFFLMKDGRKCYYYPVLYSLCLSISQILPPSFASLYSASFRIIARIHFLIQSQQRVC